MQITDTTGTIVNSYDYDVWGNFLEKEETIENPFTYFGQTYDEATGLYYLRARYYDPTTGRFTGQDPAEDGYNWYVYGDNNPILYIDPMGENILNPWYRQQVIWMNGVRALKIGGLNISGEMLHHSIRWFDSDDVYIKDEWNGTTVNGTDRIDGNNLVSAKQIMLKHCRDFGGTLTDTEVMQMLGGISRNTYYKYKKELKVS